MIYYLCIMPACHDKQISTIVLITDAFPFGAVTESSFIIPELKALTAGGRRVVVIPTTRLTAEPAADLATLGIEVCTGWADSAVWRRPWLRALRVLQPEVWTPAAGTSDLRTSLSFTASAKAFASWLRGWIKREKIDTDATLFYTFWFDFPTSALALLARRMPLRYISRAHRHDIYTRRAPRLRSMTIASSQGIYPVSQAGVDELSTRFPDKSGKLKVSRLGSVLPSAQIITKRHSVADHAITLLSVSRVTAIKRVSLNLEMAKALAIARPGTTVTWIHAGDGPLMADLRTAAQDPSLPTNLRIELPGELPNEAIHRLYSERTIDWFMLLSTSEGLPIVLCEAMSHGVPVIATDAGGTAEIVTDDTGLLLPVDVTPEEFVRGMLPYLESPARAESLSHGAAELWRNALNAETLREDFVARILAQNTI